MAHSGKGRLALPPEVMRQLRAALTPRALGRKLELQSRVAYLMGVGSRTVQRWETIGAPEVAGWGYVGVAYRIEGDRGAKKMLRILAQADLDGSNVWGKGGEI